MNEAMREKLMFTLIKKRGHENKEVIQFCNLCELEELSDKTIKMIVKRAYKKSGLDEKVYSVHTLRHTCATILYKAGCDIHTIQKLLGHVQIDTTEIYTHLHDQEVMDVMLNHPLAQYKMENALAYCA